MKVNPLLFTVIWIGFWSFVSIIGWWSWACWKSAHNDGDVCA